jgi:hypothetical protein
MNPLTLQDSFEPYYEGRASSFVSIAPSAVERARAVKERIERERKARATGEATADDDNKAQ